MTQANNHRESPKQIVTFKGVPGSPYTRKMLAYLRFRRIPYQLLLGDQSDDLNLPQAKVELLPTFYLPNTAGEIEATVDSTPIIRRFENESSHRSAIPNNPALSFLNYLIEDFADEWLTKSMFHYRWYYEADIDMAGTILPHWRNIKASPDELKQLKTFVAQRQISRLYVVGSNDTTAPVIEQSYQRFLNIMDALIQKQQFVFGERPSSADFGIYAQLTQLAKFDPTPAAICLQQAPRVYAWTDIVDDLTGNPAKDQDWMLVSEAKTVLADLLTEIGHVYAPALLANAAALQRGEDQMQTTIDGKEWVQPTFPYQAKCLEWINREYHNLDKSAKLDVDSLLKDTGCESLLISS